MKKILTILFHLIFCLPFLLFLGLAAYENQQFIGKEIFIITIAILIVLGIGQPKFYQSNFEVDQLYTIPTVLLGTIVTYSLQYFLDLNPILSASIVGLCGAFADKKLSKVISVPLYCGAFVGMTNPENHFTFPLIFTFGLIAGIVYYLSKNFYTGVGGKLGTIAFVAVISVVIIYKYFIR